MPTRRLTGSRIREKRLYLGFKQAALAETVGISPSYLNLIEHNRRRIGGKLLGDLARALNVDPALLTEGADSDLLDQMRAAATLVGETAEIARAEELAARYPGWSTLIVAQARRLASLEDSLQTLSDRMTHDPRLATSLHEVISSVTAIRSAASILVDQEQIDADWQRRFHENIYKDSLRLASNSAALIAYLDAPGDDSSPVASPMEEVEAYLTQTAFHVPQLEVEHPDVDTLIAAAGLSGHAAEQMLRVVADLYVSDARQLPLGSFITACGDFDYDPASLAEHFEADFNVVLRRLAALPAVGGHPPIGLVVCDASGTLMFVKPVPGFAMPRAGAGCPLWPLFGAFTRPGQPVRAEVALPGAAPKRFLCYAIAEQVSKLEFDSPPALQSTMLVMPDPPEGVAPPMTVGTSCRICPRSACASRREPAMAGVGEGV